MTEPKLISTKQVEFITSVATESVYEYLGFTIKVDATDGACVKKDGKFVKYFSAMLLTANPFKNAVEYIDNQA